MKLGHFRLLGGCPGALHQRAIPEGVPTAQCRDSGAAGEHGGIAPLHFLRGDVLDRMADHPVIAVGVAQGGRALPVEVILRSTNEARAGGHRRRDHGIGVVDVEMDHEAAWRLRVGRMDVELRRSEEHTSELQSLMRISYAVYCLNKKQKK